VALGTRLGGEVYVLYNIALGLYFILGFPVFLWKGLKTGKYLPTFWERMGHRSQSLHGGEPAIWIHAVSVGEVLTARGLVGALKKHLPGHRVLLSTTTLTGHAVALKSAFGLDGLFFAPFDWPGPVREVLTALNPRLLVLVETEIWPNLIREAQRRGTRIAVVNGRISPRSFVRYRRIRFFLRGVLSRVDLFLMQGHPHAERLLALGAPPGRVSVTGNLKFDAPPAPVPSEALSRLLAGKELLFVAGSTVEGEEEAVLAAYGRVLKVHPAARLLLAPRHPERFRQVPALVAAAGFRCVSRTTIGERPWEAGEVLLLDTIGELAQVYPFAAVTFVGGSLLPGGGGHNILEAAVAGRVVIVGPFMENFQEIRDAFRREKALIEVSSGEDLAREVIALLSDPESRRAIGERARAVVGENQGALARTLEALRVLLA
jgi:3-deoxy-D-manno-octulosonic-acid transferase